MKLLLIGTGIAFDLTISAMEELKHCDEIYVERYTNLIEDEKIKSLEQKLGKNIKLIGRPETESKFLIERAKTVGTIALLASGDPLTATTHVTILMDAKKAGVETKVIHNSSVYSVAAGRAGLQIYRFGKTATLVNPRDNYKPTSSLQIVRDNLQRDLHSLVLLDTEPHFMEAKTALEMLSEFENAVVLSRLGENDEKVLIGKVSELAKRTDLGKPPFCVIIPAKLHVVEEEYLASL
jgi:diphthine synthase